MEKIYVIVTNLKNGMSKEIDTTDYTFGDFVDTCVFYSSVYDVKVKRVMR